MTASLSPIDFFALSPLLILLGGSLFMLLLETFAEQASKKLAAPLALLITFFAMTTAFFSPASANDLIVPWLKFDALSKLFTVFFLAVGGGTILLSFSFFKRFDVSRGEYYFFLLSSFFGLILIGSAADFLTLFLGLETLSISLYVLCGYVKKWEISSESSIKYFLMGSLAAALLLYGIALIYGAIGTTSFDSLLNGYHELKTAQDSVLFLCGIAFVTLGLAFKAAIVPFMFGRRMFMKGLPHL